MPPCSVSTGILSDAHANVSVYGNCPFLGEHGSPVGRDRVACHRGSHVRKKTRESECSATSQSTKTLPERRRKSLSLFTYVLPRGGRRERQTVDLSSGHGVGGCGCRGAEGCLDHFNGLCVAHLLQGLHQLFDGTPRDLVGKGRVYSCVPACLQAVSIPSSLCLLQRAGWGVVVVWRGQGRST